MNLQLFSNYFLTVLAADVAADATSMTVKTGKGAGLNSPTGGNYELLALSDGTNYEVVKVTARSGDVLTVTRAHEGTAYPWPKGSQISGVLTKHTMSRYHQFDPDGNARGTDAINLQTGRTADTHVASGNKSIAMGYDGTASADSSISIGNNVDVTGGASVGIGKDISTATASYGVAIGNSVTMSGQDAVGIGSGVTASGGYSLAVASGAQATGAQSVALGNNAVASAQSCLALGESATASATNSVALGNSDATAAQAFAVAGGLASGINAIALGPYSIASGGDAVAIGPYSEAVDTGAVAFQAGNARADYAVAWNTKNRIPYSTMAYNWPVVKMDDWNHGDDMYSNAPDTVIMTPYFDLGVPPTWATATEYKNGDIVQPTTPNGYQYRLWAPDVSSTSTTKLTHTSGTEPTWTTSVGSTVTNSDTTRWICEQPTAGYDMVAPTAGTVFVPREFGFLCHKFSTLTGSPTVSIGIDSATTRYANAETVTIAAAHDAHVFTMASKLAVPASNNLRFTLAAAASAGQCSGRFWVRGFFVELPDHA